MTWVCIVDHLPEVRQAPCRTNSGQLRQLSDSGLRAGPHDRVDGGIIPKDTFFICIQIDPANQAGFAETEIIKEGTVLPLKVGIIDIVDTALAIPDEQSV